MWLAGFDGEAEVEHVAHRPDGVLDLDVHRDVFAVRGLEVESGKVYGDAVEAAVDVLPGRSAACASGGAEAGGDEDVDYGETGLRGSGIWACACAASAATCGCTGGCGWSDGIGFGSGGCLRNWAFGWIIAADGGCGAECAAASSAEAAACGGDHGHALVGGEASVDEGDELFERGVILGRSVGGQTVAELYGACGLFAGMDVVGGELADGLLLLDVGEADLFAGDGLCELVAGALLGFGALEEGFGEHGRGVMLVGIGDCAGLACSGGEEVELAPGGAFDLEVIPGLVGHVEGDGFAGEGVAVPVGELEVVEAAGEF